MSRTPPCTIAPTSPCRFPVWAEMPPILDMLGTPWITSTSPGCARLCASNSAIRLTCRRAPSSGSMRWRMLRTVSAGPAMVLPGMVGRSTDAPMTPDGMPSSSMVSEMMPVGSPSAMSRSTTPCGARGTAISLMFSAAMRPVNRFVSATVTGAPPDHQALLYRATLTCSRAAHKAAPRGRSATRTALPEGGPSRSDRLPSSAPLATVAAFPAQRFAFPRNSDRAPIDLIDACPRRTGRAPRRRTHQQRPIPMIDLYALTSPNVQKVYVMLEECGLPYKEHFVDVWKGDQYKPEFSKVNPNNKIPVIVDHDGPGGKPYTVIESGAILMYLAEKSGKFLPKDMAKKYDVMQWLMIQLTGVGPMFGQWTHFKLFAPKTGNDYSMTRYTSEIKRLYEVLEKRLGEVPYLGGQDYSIADIATFPWTRNHDAQGVKWEDNPNLARWFKSIDARPAVKAALAKIAAIKSNRETATDDQKERFFNRGQYARA